VSEEPGASVLVFGHGNFQRLTLFCAQLSLFVTILNGLSHYVSTRNVDHWCKPPEEYAHLPVAEWKNISVPEDSDGVLGSCTRYEPPLSSPSDNRTEVPCDGWDYDIERDGTTIVTEFNLVCDRRRLIPMLVTAYNAAGAITLPLAGFAADRRGRRPVLAVSVLIQMAALLASCFSGNLAVYATLRCHIAMAVSASQMTIVVVLFEVTAAPHRVMFCTLAIAVPVLLAPVTITVLTKMVSHWVLMQAMVMLPTSLLGVALYPTAESPRWLMVTWKFKKAEWAILWAARMNGLTDFNMVHAEFCRVKEGVVSQLGFAAKPAALDIVRSKPMRIRSVVIFGCWFFDYGAYFNIMVSQMLLTNATVQMVVWILSLPILVVNYYAMKTWGRRRTLSLNMILLSLLAASEAALIYLEHPFIFRMVNVAAILVLNVLYVSLFVYTIELYPTALRCMGLSGALMFARMGQMTAPVVRDILGSAPLAMKVLPLAMTGVCMFAFGLLVTLLPETPALPITNPLPQAASARERTLHSPVQPQSSVQQKFQSP
ncbi:unnamed protein product, partial [Ixodes hexagonus]